MNINLPCTESVKPQHETGARRRRFLVASLVAACLCGVAACGATASQTPTVAETITIAASLESAPFIKEMTDSFARGRAGLTIIVDQMPGSEPIAALRQGVATLAVTATPLDGERSGWLQTEIARQPIGIIVHPDNPIKNLTLDDLGNIYTGRVSEWKDVGGPAMPIMTLGREAAATVRQRIDAALIGADSRLTPNALLLPTDEAMIVTVARRPEAIGYIVGAAPNNSVKTVSIGGEQPAGLARGRYYPLWHPIILVSPAQPTPNLAAFLAYVRGRQGQRIIASWGYGTGGNLP